MESIKVNLVLNKKTYTVASAKLCKIISSENKNKISDNCKIASKPKAIEYLKKIFDFLK
jgi:hypothetical protein